MAPRTALVVVLSLLTAHAATARADDARGPTTDSALPVGIVDVSIGATVGVAGIFMEGASEKGAVLGAALGTIAVSVPLLVAGSKKVEYTRSSEGVYALGSVFVSICGTVSGGAIGSIIGNEIDGRPPAYGGAAIAMGIGSGIALLSSGIMVLGALEKSDEQAAWEAERRRERRAEAVARAPALGPGATVPRSVERRTVGQVLVGFGAASGVGAVATGIAYEKCSGLLCGLPHVAATLSLALNSAICTGIGVPLWVTGATHVPVDQIVENEAWVPEVNVGAGSASVTMRF